MLRTARYKYVAFSYGHGPEMLFDLEHDPGEMHNLAAKPECSAILNEHRRLLKKWIADTGDYFPAD